MVEKHYVAWWVAGVFTILAFITTLAQIRLHVRWNPRDQLRLHVIRILMMVPVYALESFMGLRFKQTALYFDILRECYEALVIYSFFMFLVECLHGESRIRATLREQPVQQHLAPFCFMQPWKMGSEFFYYTKLGTLQYVVIKPILAVITFILKPLDKYEDGEFDPNNGYPYIAFVNNLSQIWAMYCLILFYLATKDQLKRYQPIPKFLCVKAVVFFTFWQSVGLAVLVKLGIIHPTESYSTDNVVSGLQDFIVCVEMFIAAVAHHYAFHYKQFIEEGGPKRAAPIMRTLLRAVNVTDVYVGEVKKAYTERRRSDTVVTMGTPEEEIREPLVSPEDRDSSEGHGETNNNNDHDDSDFTNDDGGVPDTLPVQHVIGEPRRWNKVDSPNRSTAVRSSHLDSVSNQPRE